MTASNVLLHAARYDIAGSQLLFLRLIVGHKPVLLGIQQQAANLLTQSRATRFSSLDNTDTSLFQGTDNPLQAGTLACPLATFQSNQTSLHWMPR